MKERNKMKKTFAYVAILIMAFTLFTVPVSAEETTCSDCGCLECCCIDPPCSGDPKTQGYWKTHGELWEDATDLPLGYSFSEWMSILKTPSNKGPWYQLAKQFIAAWLNINVGDVYYNVEEGHGINELAAIAEAESILDAAKADKSLSDRQAALDLKDFLDRFNNYNDID
jgi:hypothetical protein